MSGEIIKEQIKLVRPSMDYAGDIMKFRREFLIHNKEEDMGGAGNLRDCQSAQKWIQLCGMHRPAPAGWWIRTFT